MSYVYKIDEKTGDKKAPPSRSLLHFIWSQVEDDCVYHEAQISKVEAQYHAPIRRIKTELFQEATLPASVEYEAKVSESSDSSASDEAAVGVVVHELLEYVAKIGLGACSEEALVKIAQQLVARSATVIDKPSASSFITCLLYTSPSPRDA